MLMLFGKYHFPFYMWNNVIKAYTEAGGNRSLSEVCQQDNAPISLMRNGARSFRRNMS